jgi:kynureninase
VDRREAFVTLSRAEAEALDRRDELASFRERFVLDEGERIYADGNSLGRLPRTTATRIEELVSAWGDRLVSGWQEWIDLPTSVGNLLGRLLGAREGEVLVCDSTTVNLYKLAHAALDLQAGAIATDAGNFPTDRYVLEGVAARRGVELRQFQTDDVEGPTVDDVIRVCAARDVAVLCLSHVSYRSGALAGLTEITAAARAAGALVLWDLSHSVGAVPLELDRARADLAIGCTYKYVNAGPGAPAFLHVRRELQPNLRSPIQGWFGQQDQFAMGPHYEPADSIERFQAGTPPVLGLVSVAAGVELVLEAGMDAIRRKSEELTELTVTLVDHRLAALGFRVATPRDRNRRGGHVALAHPEGRRISRALIELAQVVPDFRPPDVIRLGFSPLYSRFVDVWDAVDRIADLVGRREYENVDPARLRVT